MKSRVEALLAAHEKMGNFFDIGELATFLPEDTGSTAAAAVAATPVGARVAAKAQFFPGEKLGDRFVIVQCLASGGMGEVYEAIDEHLQGKHFALKVLRPEIAADPGMRQRFEREVIIACEINHTNVCPTYDLLRLIGPRGPVMCLRMRLIRGESLAVRLRRQGCVPAEAALPIIQEMAAGLDAAHAAGVIHRDFKPGNVMLEHQSQLKSHVWITDFGVSRIYESDHTMTPIGQIAGTRGYIAPELFDGKSASPASDIYAFGVVMYEMLTGRQPVPGKGSSVLSPSSLAAGIDPVWDRVILGCLDADARNRFGSASEALAVFDPRTPASGAYPFANKKQVASPRGRSGMRARWWMLLGVVVALMCGLFVFMRISHSPGGLIDGKTSNDWYEVGHDYLRHRDRKGNIENAIHALKNAASADNQNAAAWPALGEAYLNSNLVSPDAVSLNLARSSAATAVQLDPYLAGGHTELGMAELASGHPDQALKEVQRGLALNPNDSAAQMALGDVYARQQKLADAEAAYRKSVELAKSDWYPIESLGVFLYSSGRYAEAAAAYEHARELDPENAVVNRNLGAAYFKLERFDDAAAAFQRALETNPTALVYTNLGTLFFYQGRYEEAVKVFEHAVELDSSRFRYWANVADAHRWIPGDEAKARDGYAQAIRLVREALVRAPADVNLKSQLATFLAKSGETKAALAEIAAVRSGQTSQILMRAAIVEEVAGDRAKALEWLREAVHAGYSVKEMENEPELLELRKDPAYHRVVSSDATH